MYTWEEKYKRFQKELKIGISMLASVLILGTIWYKLEEHWSWLDAAYMTIITLFTVGFGEVYPLDKKSRLFTIILIVAGAIVVGYMANRFTEGLIQGYFQENNRIKQEKKLIDSLENHYILCGYGRTGRQIAIEFQEEGIPFVIIDIDPEQVEIAKQTGYIAVNGDATLDESLLGVKIDKALCLVAALRSDADNLYTILSAKTLNPKIRGVARVSTEEAIQKLQRAGADAVISPYITGGKRLAAAALRPQVMDFVDGILSGTQRSFYLEEFTIDATNCPCVGQTLREARLRSQSGALVLAIRRQNGELIAGPMGDTLIIEGDLLICMGTAEQLRLLNQILGPISNNSLRLPRFH